MVSDSIIKNPETLFIIKVLKKDCETLWNHLRAEPLNWDGIYKKTLD